ncbi:MAG: hypothetical protein ACE5IT_09295 [bacterium]
MKEEKNIEEIDLFGTGTDYVLDVIRDKVRELKGSYDLVCFTVKGYFILVIEIPQEKVKEFMGWLLLARLRLEDCCLYGIYSQTQKRDLRFSSREDEMIADIKQILRTPTAAEDEKYPIGATA